MSDFNTLPDLWVEDAESTLLDIFESKTTTTNVCEYTVKVPMRKDVLLKYTYLDDVSHSS